MSTGASHIWALTEDVNARRSRRVINDLENISTNKDEDARTKLGDKRCRWMKEWLGLEAFIHGQTQQVVWQARREKPLANRKVRR
jgi:hypothetical protein